MQKNKAAQTAKKERRRTSLKTLRAAKPKQRKAKATIELLQYGNHAIVWSKKDFDTLHGFGFPLTRIPLDTLEFLKMHVKSACVFTFVPHSAHFKDLIERLSAYDFFVGAKSGKLVFAALVEEFEEMEQRILSKLVPWFGARSFRLEVSKQEKRGQRILILEPVFSTTLNQAQYFDPGPQAQENVLRINSDYTLSFETSQLAATASNVKADVLNIRLSQAHDDWENQVVSGRSLVLDEAGREQVRKLALYLLSLS